MVGLGLLRVTYNFPEVFEGRDSLEFLLVVAKAAIIDSGKGGEHGSQTEPN